VIGRQTVSPFGKIARSTMVNYAGTSTEMRKELTRHGSHLGGADETNVSWPVTGWRESRWRGRLCISALLVQRRGDHAA
jgi:hypothetical protein